MRLGRYGKLMHFDSVRLGQGRIDRFTLFEFKPIGGIILNVFNSIEQDRFHTHAFNAWSVMLRGSYAEEIRRQDAVVETRLRTRDVMYLPRHLEHRIMKSTKNAVSVTICGPWRDTWTETSVSGRTRRFMWGRRQVAPDRKDSL